MGERVTINLIHCFFSVRLPKTSSVPSLTPSMAVPSASAVRLPDAIISANPATAAYSTNDMAEMSAPPPPAQPMDPSRQNGNILRELKDRVQELERLSPASDLKLSRLENNCMGCPTPLEQSSEGDEVGRRKGDQHERRDQLGRQGKISRWAKVLGLLLC